MSVFKQIVMPDFGSMSPSQMQQALKEYLLSLTKRIEFSLSAIDEDNLSQEIKDKLDAVPDNTAIFQAISVVQENMRVLSSSIIATINASTEAAKINTSKINTGNWTYNGSGVTGPSVTISSTALSVAGVNVLTKLADLESRVHALEEA